MSTTITSARWSESSEQNLSPDSSHFPRHESSVPKSIFDPIPPMRTSLLPHSPNKSWHQSYSSFQTSTRAQCPHVHYHPWCDECQTLMDWGQPPLIKPTYKPSIPTFGDLKTIVREKSRCQFLSKNQSASQAAIRRVCSQWRDKQFAKAVARRSAKMAAQEALRQSVHRQRAACGAAPRVT